MTAVTLTRGAARDIWLTCSNTLKHSNGRVASFIGRYYAMDRDKRWERIKEAYDLLVNGEGHKTTDILEAMQDSYDEGVTDEFMKPIVVTDDGRHTGCNNIRRGCRCIHQLQK